MNTFSICWDHGIALASGSQGTVKFSCSLCAPPTRDDFTLPDHSGVRADLSEPVISASLKHEWNPALVQRYGDPGADDRSKRLKQCEKWLKLHPDDAGLHLVLGRLCAGESLWGKAREHMIKSLELEPSSLGYDAFGQLLERQGELELAMACFRNALRMNQGQSPEPLPTTTARLSAT